MLRLFLEKPGLLKEAFKREESWSRAVPGYDSTMARHKRPMTSLERSLYKLNAVRELGEWASEFIDPNEAYEDDGNDGNMGRPIQMLNDEDKVWEMGMKELESGGQFDPDAPVFHEEKNTAIRDVAKTTEDELDTVATPTFYNAPCVTSMPAASVFGNPGLVRTRKDSVIVIIRHGKTQHNKLGLFTGWVRKLSTLLQCCIPNALRCLNLIHVFQEDAPLADEGIQEAREAGKLLKQHGFEFDVVYTSWLSRALETAWCVLDEMDCLWLPIVKTWRLNERMYGELTGLSKKMVKQRHGEEQFKAWRRGYNVR